MRKFVFTFVLVCATKCFAQIDTICFDRLHLNGPVKDVAEFTFRATDRSGFIQKGDVVNEGFASDGFSSKTNHSYSFNENAMQTEYSEYITPTLKASTTKYFYLNGKIINSITNLAFLDTSIVFKENFQYNKSGQIESCTTYRNDKLSSKDLYTYDTRNELFKKLSIGASGDIKRMTTYERIYSQGKLVFRKKDDSKEGVTTEKFQFDNNGKLVFERFDFDGFIRESKYTYTDSGEIETRTEINDKGELVVREVYQYDTLKRPAVIKECYGDGRQNTTTFTYNGDTITKSTIAGNGDREIKISHHGNILEYRKGDDVFSYKYVFDKRNNWIKVTEFKNTVPTFTRERHITYYIK